MDCVLLRPGLQAFGSNMFSGYAGSLRILLLSKVLKGLQLSGHTMRNRVAFLLAVTVLAFTATAQSSTVLRVDRDAAGGGDGSSWSSALNDLSRALSLAMAGDEIWVAEGVYKPNSLPNQSDRRNTFGIPHGVSVHGGFRGVDSEVSLETRKGRFGRTILSGDLRDNPPPFFGEDAYHVVTIADAEVTLDGFRIERGNACCDLLTDDSVGGGVRIEQQSIAHLSNLIIRGCKAKFGGGVSVRASTVRAKHIRFLGNLASRNGGGLHIESDAAESWYHSIRFESNIAQVPFELNQPVGRGGAIYSASSTEQHFANVLGRGNSGYAGGFAYVDGSSARTEWVNCTVAFNESTYVGLPGGEGTGEGFLFNVGVTGYNVLRNCIVWGNTSDGINTTKLDIEIAASGQQVSVLFSNVGASNNAFAPDASNLSTDPLFVDPGGPLLRLGGVATGAISPCIDSGSSNHLPDDEVDLDGNGDSSERIPWSVLKGEARVTYYPWQPGGDVDMGCYETAASAGPK